MRADQLYASGRAAEEVEALLRHNGFAFQRTDNRFRTVFSDSGFKWETVFVCQDETVLLYGRYPFPIIDGERARQFCESVNRQTLFGCMLLLEERLVFRTGADLFDLYSAYEQLGRALEYNAGVIVHFRRQAFACTVPSRQRASHRTPDPPGSDVSALR